MPDLKTKLHQARLYLVMGVGKESPAKSFRIAEAALKGGVDILQLRDYSLTDPQLLSAAKKFRVLTRRHRTLFIVNNRPDIARLSDADGVHVGQDDLSIAQARSILGRGKLVGLSTHRLQEAKRAFAEGADYIGVGPVFATPTKAGRPAVTVKYVRQVAALEPKIPFFAIGGIDASNIGQVLQAGASRVAVVRAITRSGDPRRAAEGLKWALGNRPR